MRPQRILVMIGVAWGIAGLVEPHLPNAGQPFNAVGAVQMVLSAILLFAWCKAHAQANYIKPPTGAPLLVGVLALVGLPYYALRAYGMRRGLD